MTVLTDAGVRAAGSSRQTRQRPGLCPSTGGTVPRAQAQSAAEQASVNSEPLSERGLYVLRLVATEVDGPDVVRELTVSLRRMRTHARSLFNKLGVSRRRAAVRQAKELDLLSRTRTH